MTDLGFGGMGSVGVRDFRWGTAAPVATIAIGGQLLLLAPPCVGCPRPEGPVIPLTLLGTPNNCAVVRISESISDIILVPNL